MNGAGTGKLQAAVVLEIDARDFLYPLIQPWPVPSKTAETLLVRRDGNDVLFLNELRHQSNTMLKLRIPLSQTNVPAVMAVLGREGVVEGRDYRGVAVLSALKHVPDSPWFVVAKVDAAEAFATWQLSSMLILALLLALAALAVAAVVVVWQRNQKAHYQALYQAQEKLRESREWDRTMFEGSQQGILVVEKETRRILYANPSFRRMLGYTEAELFKMGVQDIHPAEAMARVDAEFVALARGEKAMTEAISCRRKDGTVFPADIATALLRVAGRECVAGFFTDVTQRKQAEEALRESEEHFRRVYEQSPVAYQSLDTEGHIRDVNPAWLSLLGCRREDAIGRPFKEFLAPASQAVFGEWFQRFRGCGATHGSEFDLQQKDGGTLTVAIDGIFVQDTQNYPSHTHCVLHNITERKQAEEALCAVNEFNEEVISGANEGIIVYDRELRYRLWNPFMEHLTGLPAGEVLGRKALDVFPFLREQGIDRLLERALKGETLFSDGIPYHAPGTGKKGWTRGIYGPHRGASGEIVGVIGMVRDITEHKQAETELRHVNRALRMTSQCNQEMVRATDEAALLQAICKIAVEHGGYRMAWVGFAEQDEAKSVRPVAQAGIDEGYLDTANITWADTERGRGPTGTAIRTRKPVLARNISTDPAFEPWRAAAIQRGYASSIALPLLGEGRCFGALMIYAGEPDAFNPKEIELLAGMANDLAYGIGALRHQAERRRTGQALQESERLLRLVMDLVPHSIFAKDREGRFLFVNRACAQGNNMTPEKMVGLTDFDILPDRAQVEAFMRREVWSTIIGCDADNGIRVCPTNSIYIDGR